MIGWSVCSEDFFGNHFSEIQIRKGEARRAGEKALILALPMLPSATMAMLASGFNFSISASSSFDFCPPPALA